MRSIIIISFASAIGSSIAFQTPTSVVPKSRTNHETVALQAAASNEAYTNQPPFSLPTALFLAGLSFNAYTEPPPNSSRWERGSSGLNVAFLSSSYTRSLYSGIVEVTPLKATDLPDEDDAAESVMTGGGVDATLLVSVVEGAWKEDVQMLEKEQFHNGYVSCSNCIEAIGVVLISLTQPSCISIKQYIIYIKYKNVQQKCLRSSWMRSRGKINHSMVQY